MTGKPGNATRDQLTAWRALHRAESLLFAHLNNQLRASLGLTYFEREVLNALDHAGGRLRMAPLAEELMISRSGTTRLVAKLEKDRLVQRIGSTEDRRATWAELTTSGREMLRKAQPVIDAVVSTFFADYLDASDLRDTAKALACLADANPGIGEFECGL